MCEMALTNWHPKAPRGLGWQCWSCETIPGFVGYSQRRAALDGALDHAQSSHPGEPVKWRRPSRLRDAIVYAFIRFVKAHVSATTKEKK